LSLIWTTAANALLLLNLNPLWCAVLGRAFLGDKLPRRTIVALFLAICCMMIIFVPDIIERRNDGDDDDDEGGETDELQSSTKGNVTACITGIVLAVYISIVRKAGMKNNNINTDDENDGDDNTQVNLVGATSLAALLVSISVLIVRRGNVLPDSSSWSGEGEGAGEGELLWQFWLAVGADGMALGILFVCLTVAPRLAKGAEVALVLLLEIILGPLWVFLAYRDVPSVWTLVGGSMYV
jgi:drug/metabolite transporter (DMT)-like permease